MLLAAGFGEPTGQDWVQIGQLALAFVLSALIGLERELRNKSAGLRTHTIIGFAAALIMLVSKYGFTDILGDTIVLDPSRVAAQIVSGIGFIGGGLIFVRKDAVRGLTTAAAVWLTTAVGMAAGAGLPILAGGVTAGYFVIVFGLSPLANKLPNSKYTPTHLRVIYREGRDVLRRVLTECTNRNFVVVELSTHHGPQHANVGIREESDGMDVLGRDDRRFRRSELLSAEEGLAEPAVAVVLTLRGLGTCRC